MTTRDTLLEVLLSRLQPPLGVLEFYAYQEYQIEGNLKGEFIVILESNVKVKPNIEEEKLLSVLLDYHELATASKIAAKVLGVNKRDVYSRGIKLKR